VGVGIRVALDGGDLHVLPADLADDVGCRERLAAAGHAHERLARPPGAKAGHQLLDCLRLIARRLKLVIDLE
jgi:hypothetical protein